MKQTVVAAMAAIFLVSPADARHHHQHHWHTRLYVAPQPVYQQNWFQPVVEVPVMVAKHVVKRVVAVTHAFIRGAATALAHPPGCPWHAFCGCGAAYDLGIHDRSLWLASSWYRFPRSEPAPNTVAVRRHHVFVLKEHIQGLMWRVNNYNGRGHSSQSYIRSIAGYTIVRPQ